MELDEALSIISEISQGDKEREAFLTVKSSIVGILNDIEAYRSLYEGAVKKMARYRDVAARPDITENLNVKNGNTKKEKDETK